MPPTKFIRGCDFFKISGAGGEDGKPAATWSMCLGQSFGNTKGNSVTYLFDVPPGMKKPVMLVRYARSNAEPVHYSFHVNDVPLPAGESSVHVLPSTGGWGEEDKHWKWTKVSEKLALKPGRNRLKIVCEGDNNWITLDCIAITEAGNARTVSALKRAALEKIIPAPTVDFDSHNGIHRNSYLVAGVPLGGIGAGCFEVLPDGWWANICTNNNWDHPIRTSRGTFLAVQIETARGMDHRVLRLRKEYEFENVRNIAKTSYAGLFPLIQQQFSESGFPITVDVDAFSPLVPQDVKNSSLPMAQFVVNLTNRSKKPVKYRLIFSLENLVGQGGYRRRDKPDAPVVFVGHDSATGNYVEPFWRGNINGILCGTTRAASGMEQDVIGQHALGVLSDVGSQISLHQWNNSSEECPLLTVNDEATLLHARSALGEDGVTNPAGAIILEGELPAGKSRTAHFVYAWFMPHHITSFDGKDHGHFYLNHFKNVLDVVAYGFKQSLTLLQETMLWQDLILQSTMPDWLKFKLINGTFPAYRDGIFTKDGTFAVMESPLDMGGALGTMDQRMASHGFYTQMFTELDMREIELFRACQQSDGRITHFDGNMHAAIGDPNVSYGVTDWPDLSSSWVMQVLKLFRWTNDRAFLDRNWEGVKKAIKWMEAADKDGDFIPEGGNTYDYEKAPPGLFSYSASCYLGALVCAAELARIVGENGFKDYCLDRLAKAQQSVVNILWNGQYIRKSYDPAAKQYNGNSFIASLAGDWLARLCGVGGTMDPAIMRKNLEYLLEHHLKAFALVPPMEVTPNNKAAVTSTYVHQHEPYLGMEAIYAGFADDGMEVFRRNYEMAWQRNHVGWNMPLNFDCATGRPKLLWNYMTNTTTWSVLNALAGATLALDENALYLNPVPTGRQTTIELPLFFPHFWLWLTHNVRSGTSTLDVLKVFRNGTVLKEIRIMDTDGQVTRQALPKPFKVVEGATLTVVIKPRKSLRR